MVNRIAIAVIVVVVVIMVSACSYSAPEPGADATTPPVVAFEFLTSGIDEGAVGSTGSTALIPVLLSKPADSTVTVDCTVISGGSATELLDFAVVTHTVTFAPGETRVEVAVDVIKDFDETERAETFALALSAPRGATLDASNAIHEVTIADHILPRISFALAATSTDEDVPTMLELRLDLPADGPSTVVMGVAPAASGGVDVEDLALDEGTIISIPSGAMSVLVPVGEINDPYDELATENVTFELKGASQNLVVDATKKIAAHAIRDNDLPPVLQFKLTTSDTTEGVGTALLEVGLGEESTLPITITYGRDAADTARDADATVTGSSLSFTPRTPGVPGETTRSISVTIEDDTSDEEAETVIVDLGTATNATLGERTTHSVTILADSNDPPAVVEWDVGSSIRTESNTTHQITITVTPASGKVISLSYALGGTATNNSGNGNDDYDPNTPSPFSIPADSTTFTFLIDVNEDSANESNETVILDLTSPSNATLGIQARHTLTINDDD